ncbi:ABC transporter permease [Cytobacillus kochii]|uniref:ABC transporter permease n=1 Tax=Cytobacillus kochii TaxID=859143 RepID=UPI002E213886|nr:ABC transporter permease [Cytobacillus kochii]MED1606868.1 ABC transporter permease [Cytobacillus kochii]
MTVTQLFKHRLNNERLYKRKVWKTAIDWIVWLYVLLPILAVFLYQYYALWNGEFEQFHTLPKYVIASLLFLPSYSGTVRLFVEEGDLLFLRQHADWLHALMKKGIQYSFKQNILFVFLLAVILAPLFIVYEQMVMATFLLMVLFMVFMRFSLQLMRQLVTYRYRGVVRGIVNIGLFLLSLFIFLLFMYLPLAVQTILVILFALISWRLATSRLRWTNSFYQDCAREMEQKLKVTNFLLTAEGYIMGEKTSRSPRLLFHKSMNIYRKRTTKNIVTEMFIKLFIRRSARVSGLFRITGVIMLAITFIPSIVVKCVIILLGFVMITAYVTSIWKELKSHSFFKLYSLSSHLHLLEGVKRGIAIVVLPSSFMIGLTTGTFLFGPLYALPIAIGCGFLHYFICMRYLMIY